MGISTHVLDTAQGQPAVGIPVALERRTSRTDWESVAAGITDDDGRVGDLLGPRPLLVSDYRLTFDLRVYLGPSAFFPEAQLHFRVADESQHYHVPLLLAPYGYTTYRGS